VYLIFKITFGVLKIYSQCSFFPGSIPPRLLKHGTRCRWVVSFTTLSGDVCPYGRSGSCGEGKNSLSQPEVEPEFGLDLIA
jgi:hypothetical protein